MELSEFMRSIERLKKVSSQEAILFVNKKYRAEEFADIEEALRTLNLSTDVREVPTTRGLSEWTVLIMLPLHGALTALGSEALKLSFRRIRDFGRKRDAPRNGEDKEAVIIQDPERETKILVGRDLPIDAVDVLVDALKSNSFTEGCTYAYNRTSQRWEKRGAV